MIVWVSGAHEVAKGVVLEVDGVALIVIRLNQLP